jgi:thioredoxin-related protein
MFEKPVCLESELFMSSRCSLPNTHSAQDQLFKAFRHACRPHVIYHDKAYVCIADLPGFPATIAAISVKTAS